MNLLSNAVKFTQQGGFVFKVNYEDQVYFQIQDPGIGIAREEMERIFLPFQQTRDAKYRPEGTGIGFSITIKLIEMMGRKLKVHSATGKLLFGAH